MKWDFVVKCDPGEEVLCDFCNESYTESQETGGSANGSWAICPKCTKNLIEEPDQKANDGETFRDFVYRLRRG